MRFFVRILAMCVIVGCAAPAFAVTPAEYEQRKGITDRYSVSLGSFIIDFDTVARLDSETLGVGTSIDFEDTLRLDTGATDFRFDGYVRFGRRHRLELGYVSFRRDVTVQLDQPIQFGEEMFDIDAFVDAGFKNSVGKIAYKYSFVNNGNVEAGASFGVSVFKTEAAIAATGTAGSGTGNVAGDFIERESATAPVPLLGAFVNWTIKPRLFLRGSFEFLDVTIDDVDGRVSDARITVDWFPWEHYGFGAGYNIVSIDVTDSGPPLFFFDYEYDGILLYGTAAF